MMVYSASSCSTVSWPMTRLISSINVQSNDRYNRHSVDVTQQTSVLAAEQHYNWHSTSVAVRPLQTTATLHKRLFHLKYTCINTYSHDYNSETDLACAFVQRPLQACVISPSQLTILWSSSCWHPAAASLPTASHTSVSDKHSQNLLTMSTRRNN